MSFVPVVSSQQSSVAENFNSYLLHLANLDEDGKIGKIVCLLKKKKINKHISYKQKTINVQYILFYFNIINRLCH